MIGTFVTGTDTGIGKTVVSSLLMASMRRFCAAGYWKPVQTGIEQDDDTAEVRNLASCTSDEIFSDGVRLPRPLSPHLSARLAGRSVDIEGLLAIASRLPKERFWVVEGAGGLLVPLNSTETMADLIAELRLPALVTARSGLGTINHTLLSLAELRRRSVAVAGVAMVGEPNEENRQAIEDFGQVEVLAEVPPMPNLGPEAIAALSERLANRFRCLIR